VELRQLQYFVKVARKQHVTQAAEELHVAQSAVSRQIHQLEEELGVHLFIQKGRNLQLTPVGKLFLRRAEEILDLVDKTVLEVQEFTDPEAGEVRLAFPHSLGVNLVPWMVAAFRKEHPNVKFRFRQGNYESLISMVEQGVVDLALISPYPNKHERLEGEVVLTEELYAILPPNHSLVHEKVIRLDQLRNDEFVVFSEGYSLRNILIDACVKSGFRPKISSEGEETDTIRGLVAVGMGVSLLPEMSLSGSNSPLQPVKVKVEPKIVRTIGLIRRKGEKLPLVASVFHRFVTAFLKKYVQN
jgi:LysR family transcriptional activator of glutamate synthase operon